MDILRRRFSVEGELVGELKYGENAWQTPAGFYQQNADDPLALQKFNLQFGAPLGYNNYADVDRLLQTVTHIAAVFKHNYGEDIKISAGAKHGNVCGVGVSKDSIASIEAMIEGDERAIFGGSVMVNFDLGADQAEKLMRHHIPKGKRLLDIVIASDIKSDAEGVLQRKEGRLRGLTNLALRSLDVDSLDLSQRIRQVRGGFLVQPNYDFIPSLESSNMDKHDIEASEQQERDMLLAWAIGSTSNSNTITLVRNGKLIGNGVGQQDRVSAAELAIKRAKDSGHELAGSVAYSDSFFPFSDGPQKLIQEGVSAIFATSGSVKDNEVFGEITSSGVVLYTMPDSFARGFYAH